MKIYTYTDTKIEGKRCLSASYSDYGVDFYLIETTPSTDEKTAILSEISDYCVKVVDDDDTTWDCDSSRDSESYSVKYVPVPTDEIILRDGHFYGYRVKAQIWSGGAMSETKRNYTAVVTVDHYSTDVNYYSVTTSDYDRTSTTYHRLILRSELPEGAVVRE